MPSLSQDPATDREMYPGTMAIMDAATKPAPSERIRFTKCRSEPTKVQWLLFENRQSPVYVVTQHFVAKPDR